MATSTPNLGLTLPIGNEHVSRQIINENMMILDESATNFDFNPDAMRDAILAVQDVTHVKIVLNRSDEEVNGIPAKSLLALVNNGGKTNICQAIYDTNTSGLETAGTLEKEIEGVTIKFSRPSLYALHFNITLEGFTAPSLTNIETSIKNALMTYINRTLQIGEVLSMENVRQIVYNAAGSEAANFRIKDLSCSGSQGVSRDFMDPGWNNKFTMSSGSDVTITSVQSQSSQAIDALNNNTVHLNDSAAEGGAFTDGTNSWGISLRRKADNVRYILRGRESGRIGLEKSTDGTNWSLLYETVKASEFGDGKARIYRLAGNLSTFVFEDLPDLTSDRYKHFLLVLGDATNANDLSVFIGGVGVNGASVSFKKIIGGNYALTGSIANSKLTITSNVTCYGGMRLIWLA